MEISDNQIRSYNNSGELHGLATNNASNFGDIEFYDDDNLVFRIYNRTQGGGVSLIPENEASLVVGKEEYILGLNGSIVLNGIVVPSITSKTAGATYGTIEQQMLQELHDKLKQLLDAINNN
jgi:hypothetical protein